MVSSWILLLVSIGYAALLFGVAWWGDRRPMYPDRPWLRPVIKNKNTSKNKDIEDLDPTNTQTEEKKKTANS